MEIRKKKIMGVPVLALAVFGLVFGAGVIGALYWSSQEVTHTVSVEGWIDATTNFAWIDLEDTPDWTTLEGRTVDLLLETGGAYILRVVSSGSNAEDCYATITITCPGSSTATVNANVLEVIDGVKGTSETLVEGMAYDGSQSVQVLMNSDADWFYSSTYGPGGSVKVLYFVIYLDVDPNLGIGDHVFSATVGLADSL